MAKPSFEVSVNDLAHSIGMLVRRVRAAFGSGELSLSEASTLNELSRQGRATTAELARIQGMRPQSMRTIVAALEQMEMVKRTPHETDGRQVNLELTAKGAAAQKSTRDAKRTWLAQTISQLDKQEQETLFAAGEILRRIVEQDRG